MSDGSYDASQIIQSIEGSFDKTTSGVTTFALDNNPQVIAGFNQTRRFLIVQNGSGGTLYIRLGVGVTFNTYSFKIRGDTFASISDYTGPVSVVSDTRSTDTVLVTEIG